MESLQSLHDQITSKANDKGNLDRRKREVIYKRAASLRERWNEDFDCEEEPTSSGRGPSIEEILFQNEKEIKLIRQECGRINEDLRRLQKEANDVKKQMHSKEEPDPVFGNQVSANSGGEASSAKQFQQHESGNGGILPRGTGVTTGLSTTSPRDALRQRIRAQNVLAKISPRYQLQYKIDLALQRLYEDMDGKEERDDEYSHDSDANELPAQTASDAESSSASSSSDSSSSNTSDHESGKVELLDAARNTSVTSSSDDSDGERSPRRGRKSPEPLGQQQVQTDLAFSAGQLDESEQRAVFDGDVQPTVSDDVSPVGDDVAAAPVPKPRLRKQLSAKQEEEELIADEHAEIDHNATAMTSELESNLVTSRTEVESEGSIESEHGNEITPRELEKQLADSNLPESESWPRAEIASSSSDSSLSTSSSSSSDSESEPGHANREHAERDEEEEKEKGNIELAQRELEEEEGKIDLDGGVAELELGAGAIESASQLDAYQEEQTHLYDEDSRGVVDNPALDDFKTEENVADVKEMQMYFEVREEPATASDSESEAIENSEQQQVDLDSPAQIDEERQVADSESNLEVREQPTAEDAASSDSESVRSESEVIAISGEQQVDKPISEEAQIADSESNLLQPESEFTTADHYDVGNDEVQSRASTLSRDSDSSLDELDGTRKRFSYQITLDDDDESDAATSSSSSSSSSSSEGEEEAVPYDVNQVEVEATKTDVNMGEVDEVGAVHAAEHTSGEDTDLLAYTTELGDKEGSGVVPPSPVEPVADEIARAALSDGLNEVFGATPAAVVEEQGRDPDEASEVEFRSVTEQGYEDLRREKGPEDVTFDEADELSPQADLEANQGERPLEKDEYIDQEPLSANFEAATIDREPTAGNTPADVDASEAIEKQPEAAVKQEATIELEYLEADQKSRGSSRRNSSSSDSSSSSSASSGDEERPVLPEDSRQPLAAEVSVVESAQEAPENPRYEDLEVTVVNQKEDQIADLEVAEESRQEQPEEKGEEEQDKEEVGERAGEDEMRIIEHTGLINHDEDPEEGNSRNAYNAAHSQRNTDATKWFGEPKPKDKVWLKPKGKVDDDAEAERKKVIKAMTRKHNPNLITKWRPTVEKDWKDNLDSHKLESMRKYEERRRFRIESDTTDPPRLRAPSTDSLAESHSSEGGHPSSEAGTYSDTVEPSSSHSEELSSKPVVSGNSEIVFEPVVHSKDAISRWESRLSSKFEKEETEKKRLSVGKQRRTDWEARRRERTESTSSVTSSTSSMSEQVLPTSENIIRESIGVSGVRSRWKNMEQSSVKASPSPVKKEASAARRSKSFTVNAGSSYRSFGQSPKQPKNQHQQQAQPQNLQLNQQVQYNQQQGEVGARLASSSVVIMRQPGETLIDFEIREAAEREELWRTERSASQDSHPMSPTPGAASTERNEPPAKSPEPEAKQQVAEVEEKRTLIKSDSIVIEEDHIVPVFKERAQTLPNLELAFAGGDVTSDDDDKRATLEAEVADGGADSGIECNASGGVAAGRTSGVTSPSSEEDKLKSSLSPPPAPAAHDDDYASSELSATSQEDRESQASKESPRVSSLPIVMSPKGWSSKHSMVSPVSPKPTTHFESKPFTITSAHSESPVQINGVKEAKHTKITPSSPAPAPVKEQEAPTSPKEPPTSPKEPPTSPKEPPTSPKEQPTSPREQNGTTVEQDLGPGVTKTTVVLNRQRSGPSFEILSSKSRLQTIMEQEIKDAEKREEEWRLKQLAENRLTEDGTYPTSPHTPRKTHTPSKAPMSPTTPVETPKSKPVVYRKPSKAVQNGQNGDAPTDEEQRIREQKLKELADEATKKIVTSTNENYRKRTVVMANRVPRRKSNLAMRWEAGKFQNDEDE